MPRECEEKASADHGEETTQRVRLVECVRSQQSGRGHGAWALSACRAEPCCKGKTECRFVSFLGCAGRRARVMWRDPLTVLYRLRGAQRSGCVAGSARLSLERKKNENIEAFEFKLLAALRFGLFFFQVRVGKNK